MDCNTIWNLVSQVVRKFPSPSGMEVIPRPIDVACYIYDLLSSPYGGRFLPWNRWRLVGCGRIAVPWRGLDLNIRFNKMNLCKHSFPSPSEVKIVTHNHMDHTGLSSPDGAWIVTPPGPSCGRQTPDCRPLTGRGL